MSKNKTRLIVVIAAIVTIISTFCYAETETTNNTNVDASQDVVTTSYEENGSVNENARSTEQTNESQSNYYNNQEIHEGDLYLFDSDIVMDQLVDGNVFIFGNNVTISGQVSGNIFVCGNNITFDKAYIQASVFVCGSNVKFNAVSNSLYCASKDLTIDNQFGVYTDMYASCANFTFDGIIGRNAYLASNSINLNDNATFYGDLNYTSESEIELPNGMVEGDINYTKATEIEKSTSSLSYYISDLIQVVVFVIIAFFVVKFFTTEPNTKECTALSHPFKTFGIGLLSIIVIPVLFLLLLISVVGLATSMAVLSIYLILLILSSMVFSISLARYICISKQHRGIKEFLLTIVITIITWGLSLIPFIGWIFSLIVSILGFGIMIYTPLLKKAHCKNKNIINTKDESPVKDSKKSDNADKSDKSDKTEVSDNTEETDNK